MFSVCSLYCSLWWWGVLILHYTQRLVSLLWLWSLILVFKVWWIICLVRQVNHISFNLWARVLVAICVDIVVMEKSEWPPVSVKSYRNDQPSVWEPISGKGRALRPMSEQLRTFNWPHVSSRELSEDSAGIRRWETFTHLLRLCVNSREKSSRGEIFRNIQSLKKYYHH